jgi:hypothetical protein
LKGTVLTARVTFAFETTTTTTTTMVVAVASVVVVGIVLYKKKQQSESLSLRIRNTPGDYGFKKCRASVHLLPR